MKILSVTLEKCSGCALMIDNKIVFSTSEERYSRIKSDSSFPKQSIIHALEFAKIEGNELDQVIICGNKLSLIPSLTNEYSTLDVNEQLRLMREYWYPTLVEKKSISFLDLLKDKINRDQYPFNTEFAKNFDYFSLENPYTDDDAVRVSNFFKDVLSDLLKIEKSKIVHITERKAEVQRLTCDAKLCKRLGWRHKVDIKTGLKLNIEWAKKNWI